MDLLHATKGVCVNIGSSDGDDVCDQFFRRGYDGVCAEPVAVSAARAYVKTLPGNVRLVEEFVTPDNVRRLIGDVKHIDLLKIDIDGYDLALMRSILSFVRPTVVIVEFNETVHADVEFEVPYVVDRWPYTGGSHLFGASIRSFQNTFNDFWYKIVDMTDEFQRNNIVATIGVGDGDEGIRLFEKYHALDNQRYFKFPWNVDTRNWSVDKDTCSSDLRNMVINAKYGTRLPTSLDAEPRIDATRFGKFVSKILSSGRIRGVADVGTYNRSGFSRLVIDHVLEHDATDVSLYRVESVPTFYHDTKRMYEDSYGDVVSGFTTFVHGRIVDPVKIPQSTDISIKKTFECWSFWTGTGPPVRLPHVDMAFVHCHPAWLNDYVDRLGGCEYISFFRFVSDGMGIDSYDVVFSDHDFVIIRRARR